MNTNTTIDRRARTPQPVLDDEIHPALTLDQIEAENQAEDSDIRRRAAVGVPLVAQIKRSSKYHGQGTARYPAGARFPVVVVDESDEYVLRGGPGGRYRLADVNLFAVVFDKQVKLT